MASSIDLSSEDAARLTAVRRYEVLDTPPDGAFDRITSLAARIFEVPISIVSIVDHDRIWFKSHHGIDVEQIDREPGLCASAIMQKEPWVVSDASVDPRTLTNSLVCGDLGLRFYVGIPLCTSDGHNLGTFNIIDVEPREFGDDDLEVMKDLAAVIMDELELRLSAKRLVTSLRERHRYGIELNDDVVQSLVLAKFSLEMGETEKVQAAVEGALEATKRIASALFAEDELRMDTTDLVRTEAADPLSSR
jgi:GAF domain-containing protein